MLRALRLEWVDSENDRMVAKFDRALCGHGKCHRRPWVAEIIGIDPRYRFARNFVECQIDYSQANGKGSRGVFLYFFVEVGRVYEVFRNIGWRRTAREYLLIESDGERSLSEAKVVDWLARVQKCFP
jgi:hypothetical protein